MVRKVKFNISRNSEFIVGLILTIFVLLSFFTTNILITYHSQRKNINEKTKIVIENINDNISRTLTNIDSVHKSLFLNEDFQAEIDNIYDSLLYSKAIQNIGKQINKVLTSIDYQLIKDVGYIPRNLNGELDISNLIIYGINSQIFVSSYTNVNLENMIKKSQFEKNINGSLFVMETYYQNEIANQICFARNVYSLRNQNYNELMGIGFVCIDRIKLYELLNYSLVIDGLYSKISNNELSFYSSNSKNVNYDFSSKKFSSESMSLSFYDWKFYTYYDRTYILRTLQSDIINATFISIVIIIIYITLYFLLHRRNLKSLNYLFDSFSIANNKKELQPMDFISDPEVNNIIQAYNDMVFSINKLNNDILLEKDLSMQYQLKKQEFEIKSLYSQINKHFIINVLSIVHSLINLKDVDKANYCLENLSDFLRYSLTLKSESNMSDELKSIQSYLNIQSIRYPKVVTSVNSSNEINDIIVPKLIIQPLVENAFVHGMINKVGNIELKCFMNGNTLFIQVNNDGKIIPQDQLNEINSKIKESDKLYMDKNLHGIALINIQKRLNLMYGNNANLKIISNEDNKTISSIEINLEENLC